MNWDIVHIYQGPEVAWKGEYFYSSLATTLLYFFVDLLWVARIPTSVKSPDVIIKVCMKLATNMGNRVG
jgi:hypothetical protein